MALTRTMTSEMTRHDRWGLERCAAQEKLQRLDTSCRWKSSVEPEYFHILLCEVRIYLDKTRCDFGKTNRVNLI